MNIVKEKQENLEELVFQQTQNDVLGEFFRDDDALEYLAEILVEGFLEQENNNQQNVKKSRLIY